ncbi:MAG: amino acid dehydrogenase [Planctomycetes bacterium]|nr:amino acid dehydrogenase [Planctomycetota bacterium]
MATHILDAMSREGFEEVLAVHDARSGLRAFLAIHDSSAGPAFGGVRRWAYEDEDGALRDALRLARAMTYKCALAGLPAGGAKMTILDRGGLDLPAAYRAVGDLAERLAGRWCAGPDVGTGEAELRALAARTRHATDPGPSGPGELVESTVEGVFRGLLAALEHLDGEADLPRRSIVVQGLGEVGAGLARRLVARGARVRASDLDSARARAISHELEIELVDPATEFDQRCDVFAPCALGGILHDLSIARLRCRVVAGGANNVLARHAHGERLHERGILFAPDFVLNAGALVRGALFHLEGRREPVAAIGDRVAATTARILDRARAEGWAPSRVAIEEAEDVLAERRARRV